MGSFSIWHWLIVFMVIGLILFSTASGAAKMGTLVIKHWKAETKPIDQNNNFVTIIGRRSGFVAWLLSQLRIDPVTTILIGLDRVAFQNSSLAGTESRLIPLQNVCSTYYGYHKPWKAAMSILLTFAFLGGSLGASIAEQGSQGGAFMSFIVLTGIGLAVSLAYYFLNRTLTLGFVEQSGVILGIRFKRSMIENIDINQEQAKSVCLIIQRLIEAKERRNLGISTK